MCFPVKGRSMGFYVPATSCHLNTMDLRDENPGAQGPTFENKRSIYFPVSSHNTKGEDMSVCRRPMYTGLETRGVHWMYDCILSGEHLTLTTHCIATRQWKQCINISHTCFTVMPYVFDAVTASERTHIQHHKNPFSTYNKFTPSLLTGLD